MEPPIPAIEFWDDLRAPNSNLAALGFSRERVRSCHARARLAERHVMSFASFVRSICLFWYQTIVVVMIIAYVHTTLVFFYASSNVLAAEETRWFTTNLFKFLKPMLYARIAARLLACDLQHSRLPCHIVTKWIVRPVPRQMSCVLYRCAIDWRDRSRRLRRDGRGHVVLSGDGNEFACAVVVHACGRQYSCY